MSRHRLNLLVALAGFALPYSASAQTPKPAPLALATREQLQAELTKLQQSKSNNRQADLIRDRLAEGDFQPGDRLLLQVEGEAQLTDTFTVGGSRELQLPQVGSVSLQGLLRSELEPHLRTALSQYFRDPVVTARPLITLLVTGEVPRPGYYALNPEQPVVDAVTAAGGLSANAVSTALRIDRNHSTIWSGVTLQQLLARGSSVDQLSLRPGDQILVPGKRDFEKTVRVVAYLCSIILAGYTIAQVAGN